MHLVFENEKDTAALQKELKKAYQKIGQLEMECYRDCRKSIKQKGKGGGFAYGVAIMDLYS